MQEDPALKIKGGVGGTDLKSSDFYQLGLSQLDITGDQINKAGRLIHILSIIKLEGLRPDKYPEKGVTNDHHRHLQGAIFAFGTEGANQEWREHGASSIREMISAFSTSEVDFNNTVTTYGNNQKPQNTQLKNIEAACIKIKKYYQFFSGVTHHQPAAIINGFRQLEDPNTENEKCQTTESFKLVFNHFFVDMKKIIEIFPDL